MTCTREHFFDVRDVGETGSTWIKGDISYVSCLRIYIVRGTVGIKSQNVPFRSCP